jgi:crossover junction endonuclease EME1
MQEVIDLTTSSPSHPATAGSRTRPRSSSVNARRLPTNLTSSITCSSPHFLSDEFDASLFVYDENNQQPAKKRKLTPEFETAQNDLASSVKSHAEDSLFIFSDELIPPLPSASRADARSTAANTYKWDGEESDPIVFTSSAPEPAPRNGGQELLQSNVPRTTAPTITIDDDIQEFSDPFSLPDDVLSSILEQSQKSTQGRLSSRTAALLASLENRTASRAQGTGSGPRSERKKDEPDLNSLLSDEPIEQQPQNKPRPKRQPKLSAAEKEAKAREREAAKAQREREKEAEKERKRLQKEEKAKEKQLAADLAEVNRLKVDKKDSTPEMIVDLATTFADTSVGNQVSEFMRHLGVERTFFTSSIRNIVKWRRKVKATFDEEAGHWKPCPLHIRLEDHVLCLLSAQEFVNMVIAPLSQAEADPDDAETLELHVLRVKSAYPDCKVMYLIEGLTAWMRKNQNSRNRAFQAEVVRQLNDTNSLGDPSNASSRNGGSQARARKKKAQKPEDSPPVDEDTIEDALLQLQVTYACLIHHTAAAAESAEWIKNFTEHISTIPYRRERMDLNDSAFCMERGQVKPGEDRADTFVKMLQEVNRVTAPIAYGIAAHYPSATDLLRAMKQHGPGMLEDVKKSANKNGALTDSRIGPAVSRRLYKVFMGLDPTSTDI